MNVNRKDKARSSELVRYQLRCPAGCPSFPVEGRDQAARLIGQHASTCPNPGPAWRPVPGGAVIRPMIYADRIA